MGKIFFFSKKFKYFKICFNNFRFLTSNIEGVKLAEEICEKPKRCLTLLLTEDRNIANEVLTLKYPDNLVNVIWVSNIWHE